MIDERISAARVTSSETAGAIVTTKNGRSACSNIPYSAVCVGCRRPIRDQYMLHVDPGLDWHTACLRCAQCSQPLDESCTCFVREGRAYCKPDYTRLFGVKCARCGLDFDQINLVMRARERIYHIDCFRCVTCELRLISGDEFALRAADGGLVCRDHYDVRQTDEFNADSTAAPAGGGGGEEVVLCGARHAAAPSMAELACGGNTVIESALDGLCVDVPSTNASFATNNASTAACSSSSSSSDTDVNSKLCQPGNCSPPTSRTSVGGGKKQATGSGNGSARHVSRAAKSGTLQTPHSGAVTKTTRIRTVLNEKQLHTLRTCYAANPRPDALMKDQLVEMTGLSSRVIRVWFQNKRCKDKKRTILIKQLQQQHQDKVHGVPMIASSPIRMQDQSATMLEASAVQIHQQYVHQQVPGLSSDSPPLPAILQHPAVESTVPPVALGPTSMQWSAAAGAAAPCLPATVMLDYGGLPAGMTPTLMVSEVELDYRAAPTTTAAFQQLLESFGYQPDIDDEVDDDSVVNVDEKTPPLQLTRNTIKPARSMNKQQQQQQHKPKLPPIVPPQHHAVCSAARC